MYNGIGLPTPRGSGTSGYIQKNLGHVPSKRISSTNKRDESKHETPEAHKRPRDIKEDSQLQEHRMRRQIEIDLLQYVDEMEAQGFSGDELDEMVQNEREKRTENLKHRLISNESGEGDKHQNKPSKKGDVTDWDVSSSQPFRKHKRRDLHS